jgi:hypothetical protein
MPSIAAIPRNNFSTRFEAAKTEILAYFEFARDIAVRFASQLAAQRLLEESGKRPRSRRIKAGKICCILAARLRCSMSFIYQCRSSARAFSAELVEEILAACEATEFVPTQEFFIALTRIPIQYRPGWIEAAVRGHWNASQIKEECKREYGVRSNGGKEPMRPRSLPEALSKFDAAYARLNSVFERLREVQVGVSGGPEGVSFRVPRSLMTNINECRTALDALRKGLTGISQPVRRRAA